MRVITFASLALLVACQSGKPGGSIGSRPQQVESMLTLSGRAYFIAPVQGARVKAERFFRSTTPELLGETQTDQDGAFTFAFDGIDGDILLTVDGASGGSTLEPVTGVAPISLSQDDALMVWVTGTQPGENRSVNINWMTTLMAARTLSKRAAGATIAEAYAQQTALFSAHFGYPAPWDTQPVDLAASEAPGISISVVYSLATLGFSQHALTLGERAGVTDVSVVNSLTLLRQLVRDIGAADATFDGMADGQPLNVQNNVFLDAEATRLSLAKGIDAFLSSSKNLSGLTARDASNITNAIRTDTSELYPVGAPPEDRDATVESGAGPVIVFTSPTTAQVLASTDFIVGYAEDLDGVSSVQVLLDGVESLVPMDTSLVTKWVWSFTPQLADGAHLLTVIAQDAKGNSSTKDVSFSVDTTGPSISFVSCTASDDRTKTVTTSASGASFGAMQVAEPCSETSLQAGTQVFHVYADQLFVRDATPKISIAVGDASEVTSVTYSVTKGGQAWVSSRPLPASSTPATHEVTVSVDDTAPNLPSLTPSEQLMLTVVAKDKQGNETTRSFSLSLDLLATPLHVVSEPLDPSSAVTTYSFAGNNVEHLFDPDVAIPGGLIRLGQYRVSNVSTQAVVVATRSGWAAPLASFNRKIFRTFLGGAVFDGTGTTTYNNCAVGRVYSAAKVPFFGYFEGCNSYDYPSTETLEYPTGANVETTVYELPANVELTPNANGDVSLEAGRSYRFVLGVPKLHPGQFVVTDDDACSAQSIPSSEDYYESISEGAPNFAGNVPGFASKGGFMRKHTFARNAGASTHHYYGFMSCKAYKCLTSNCGCVGSGCGRVPTGAASWSYMVGRTSWGGVFLGSVYFERGIHYSSSAAWAATVRLLNGASTRAARDDGSTFGVLPSYSTEPNKPVVPSIYPVGELFTLQGW